MLYEPRAQDAHESGEHDKVWLIGVKNAGNRAVEGLSVSIVTMFQALGSNARSLRACQAKGVGLIAENNSEVEINLALRCFVNECLKIATRSRDQDRGLAK